LPRKKFERGDTVGTHSSQWLKVGLKPWTRLSHHPKKKSKKKKEKKGKEAERRLGGLLM